MKGRGRCVETEEYRSTFQKSTSNGKTLLLNQRNLQGTRTHNCFVIIRTRENEVKYSCLASCMFDVLNVVDALLIVRHTSIANIVLNSVIEEATVLRHNSNS